MQPTRGKVETTDHPPIHPTGQGDPTTLDGGQLKLYKRLIARRFLATLSGARDRRERPSCPSMSRASPSPPAATCWSMPVYARRIPTDSERDEQLPALKAGDTVDVHDIKLEAKQAEPPRAL